jgi:hypothetical protein
MMLVTREKPDSSAHMSPEDQAYFDQVTLHLGSVILATGSVLRRIVKKPFCGKVRTPCLMHAFRVISLQPSELAEVHVTLKKGFFFF